MQTDPSSSELPRGERRLVRRLGRELGRRAAVAGPDAGARVPFGDDMAELGGAGRGLLWTVDMLMDGVDFDSAQHDWDLIGRKAMAVNLSDCAAMGARPIAALCAVSLCNRLGPADAEALVLGADALGRRYGCPIVGGDTNSWDAPTVISVTVAGESAGERAIRRDGARPGDELWVSGRLGGSILGRHLTFEPRVALGQQLARELPPHAMIDISDGLAIDLDRLCEASGVGAVLNAAALDAVIHDDARRLATSDGRSPRDHALYDGEDFELLMALPPSARDVAARLGLLPIGKCVAERGLWLESSDAARAVLAVGGWEHFR